MLEPLSGSEMTAGRRLHAGNRAQPRQQLIEERDLLRLVLVSRIRQRQLERERLLDVEAGIDRRELDEAAHQQPRAGKQHHRERHLRDTSAPRIRAPPRVVTAPRGRLPSACPRRTAARRLKRRNEHRRAGR